MTLVRMALVFGAAHVAAACCFLLDRAPGTGAALTGLPLDDAFIHLVYARSLAAWQGFAYNPGQLETGATSPLWALLLVPATWLARLFGVGVVVPAKLTGVLTGVGTSVAASAVAGRLGLGRAAQLAVGLAIAVDPALAFAQVSGMEILLAAAFGLAALALLASERARLAAVAAALAPLARPEMAVLTVVVFAQLGWRLHRQHARARDWLLVLAPLFFAVGGWAGYCLAVTGHPLPSTFYAKLAIGSRSFSQAMAVLLGEVVPAWAWFAHGAGLVAWAVGTVALFRRGPLGIVTAGFPLVYLLGVAASHEVPQGWPFYWQRYWLPALPFMLVGVVTGGVAAVRWARRPGGGWLPGRAAAAVLLMLGTLAGWPRAFQQSADRYAWNCQNIDELNVAMALWLRAHVPAGETIAVTDAGAARYFAEHPIFDVVGLNNHRFLHRGRGADAGLDRIRWVAAFPQLVPFLRDRERWRVVHRVSTDHLTICDCPQSELLAFQRGD